MLPRVQEVADRVAAALKQRGETVAVAESAAGGLISAALLAVPRASSYYRGGVVVYTTDAKVALVRMSREWIAEHRSATEEHTLELARATLGRLGATWCVAETGAAGPTGNSYGDPAGHVTLAVAGPRELSATVETGSSDRVANMEAFAVEALRLLEQALGV